MQSGSLIVHRSCVFATPYFNLVAKTVAGQTGAPYYSIATDDYVTILAITPDGEIPLVRQFRPAVEDWTLELPSGHVDAGETPEEAARRELLEETGFKSTRFELLGCLNPDTGRLGNRHWCYFASDASMCESEHLRESGLELLLCRRSQWHELLTPPRFAHSLHLAALYLGLMHGKLSIEEFRPRTTGS